MIFDPVDLGVHYFQTNPYRCSMKYELYIFKYVYIYIYTCIMYPINFIYTVYIYIYTCQCIYIHMVDPSFYRSKPNKNLCFLFQEQLHYYFSVGYLTDCESQR